jgi:hypothetical protein
MAHAVGRGSSRRQSEFSGDYGGVRRVDGRRRPRPTVGVQDREERAVRPQPSGSDRSVTIVVHLAPFVLADRPYASFGALGTRPVAGG